MFSHTSSPQAQELQVEGEGMRKAKEKLSLTSSEVPSRSIPTTLLRPMSLPGMQTQTVIYSLKPLHH